MNQTIVIAVKRPPHTIIETTMDEGESPGVLALSLERRGYTTCVLTQSDRMPMMTWPKPTARYILKKYDQNDHRLYFWQVPWIRKDEDGKLRECGGWLTASRFATIYGDPEEAEKVNLLLRLEAAVDEARI